jgi:glutaredoxin
MKKTALCVVLISLLYFPCILQAQVYSWVDKNGTKHYSDTAPENRKGLRDFKVIENSPDSRTSGSGETDASSDSSALQDPQKKAMPAVKIYTTPWCKYCKRAKAWMNQNAVPYEEFDVEKSAENDRQYKALGGKSVPLILVGNRRMSGWDEGTMRQLLGMNQ